jgi:hypothetical protein
MKLRADHGVAGDDGRDGAAIVDMREKVLGRAATDMA